MVGWLVGGGGNCASRCVWLTSGMGTGGSSPIISSYVGPAVEDCARDMAVPHGLNCYDTVSFGNSIEHSGTSAIGCVRRVGAAARRAIKHEGEWRGRFREYGIATATRRSIPTGGAGGRALGYASSRTKMRNDENRAWNRTDCAEVGLIRHAIATFLYF